MVTTQLDERVRILLDAEAERREVGRIDPDNALSEDEAYRLQFQGIDAKVARGDSVIGLKTGLTSRAKQETMGVHQPIFGHLLHSTVIPEGAPVSCAELIHPRAEPELAFLLEHDLAGPVTAAQACQATALVFPAVEIIDSRFLNFKFGLSDVIADNTSASRVIFGSAFLKPTDADLRLIGMVYAKNGIVESTAAGAAILGNPWEALAWLARRASELGRPLRAGHMVLAGALADAVFVNPGDSVRVEFDKLGITDSAVRMTRVENIRAILRVADLDTSVAYYVDKLGFTMNWREGGMAGVGRDGCEIMLCHGNQGNPGTWLWIGLDDAGAFFEEVSSRDVNVRLPLTNYPYAYEFNLVDPDGHVLRFGSEPRDDIPYAT